MQKERAWFTSTSCANREHDSHDTKENQYFHVLGSMAKRSMAGTSDHTVGAPFEPSYRALIRIRGRPLIMLRVTFKIHIFITPPHSPLKTGAPNHTVGAPLEPSCRALIRIICKTLDLVFSVLLSRDLARQLTLFCVHDCRGLRA